MVYRCYRRHNEVNSFYIFNCTNEHMTQSKYSTFDILFYTILSFQITSDMKELLFQTLINNKDYNPRLSLSNIYSNLSSFDMCNLSHGFYPVLIIVAIYPNIIIVRRAMIKLIKVCFARLYSMLIIWCNLIHITISNESSMKELLELWEEVSNLIQSAPPFIEHLRCNKIVISLHLSTLPPS
jgi:hypothetical protein